VNLIINFYLNFTSSLFDPSGEFFSAILIVTTSVDKYFLVNLRTESGSVFDKTTNCGFVS